MLHVSCLFIFFFFNDTATTEIYTLSLHDALPICLVDASSMSLTPSLEKENLTWKYYRIRRLLYLNFVMLIPHSFSALMDCRRLPTVTPALLLRPRTLLLRLLYHGIVSNSSWIRLKNYHLHPRPSRIRPSHFCLPPRSHLFREKTACIDFT